MTRLDSFKMWLKKNGADPDDFARLEEISGNMFGCFGFLCPVNNCDKCRYHNFWTEEAKDDV